MVSRAKRSVVSRNRKPDTCRIGEKFLDWVDDPLALEDILESVTLYWLTETFPRAIYTYRQVNFPIIFDFHQQISDVGK